jgi:hypothetical protein
MSLKGQTENTSLRLVIIVFSESADDAQKLLLLGTAATSR